MQEQLRIGVFGHGCRASTQLTPGAEEWIHEFGRLVALSGAALFTGGARGVGRAARIGALSEKGDVISIHPDAGRDLTTDDSEQLGTVVATGHGKLGRVATLVQSLDLAFAFGGGSGTLIEILACYISGVPVVIVEGLTIWATPDPAAILSEVVEFEFGGRPARRGYFDGKSREVVWPPVLCSADVGPEHVLALGEAEVRSGRRPGLGGSRT
jgi:uncharacterized protein (TIGR00725 family)